ncbi:MAG: hypothetical protein ACK5MD_09870 [Flavobacteriales bacterium]
MYFIILIVLFICVWFFARKTISKYFKFIQSGRAKIIATIFIVVFGIICSLLYWKYDSKGFEYGLSCNFCRNNLPYNLIPESDRYGSFTLKDEDDFELIGNGLGYKKSSFIIKDFLAYGYNDTSVVVKCSDSLNNIKYLTSYETGYKSKKGNPEISFKDLSNSDFEQIKDKYQWFEVDKEMYYAIEGYKFLSMLGVLLSLLLLLISLFKLRKAKAP